MTNPWDDAPYAGEELDTEDSKGIVTPKTEPWENAPIIEEPPKGMMPYVKEAVGGFNVGLAEAAGVPVDITNTVLSKIGLGSEDPIMGSEWVKRQAEKAGDMFFEPQTTGGLGRVLRRTGQELGTTVLPAAGIMRAATKASPVYRSTKSLIRKIILDPIKRSPGTAALGELTATTGAGVGAGIAREIAPRSQTAETTGQIVGSLAPSVLAFTPGVLAAKGVKRLFSRFSPKGQRKAAVDAVKRVMGDELSGEAQERLNLAKRFSETVQGFDPSVPEAVGSRALIRQQEQLEQEATGAFLDKITNRRKQNIEAINRYAKTAGPQAGIDPEFIVDTANNRIKTVGNSIDSAISRNQQKKQDLAKGILTVDRMAAGRGIREGINRARSEASFRMSLIAKELGLSDIDLSDAFSTFQSKLIQKYSPESRFEDVKAVPSIYREIIKDKAQQESAILGPGGEKLYSPVKTTFEDIKAIRERVSDDIINELGTAVPNRRKLRMLLRMRGDVDSFIDEQSALLGDTYRQFRTQYFEEYIKPFEQGAIFKSKNKDGTGFYRTNDEKVAELFIDSPTAAKQFGEIFEKDPEMMKNFGNAVLDNLKRNAVDDGILNEKKLARWIKKHEEVLDQLPSIRDQVSSVEGAVEGLTRRDFVLGRRKLYIENLALSKQLARYGRGDIIAEDIIDQALKNPARMKQLKRSIAVDPAALNGLKKVIWDQAVEGNSADVVRFMSKYDKSLSALFDKTHLKNMYDISFMRSMIEQVRTPTGTAYKPRPLEEVKELTGMDVPQFESRGYAFFSGRVPKHYLLAGIATTALRKRAQVHADQIFKEALYDRKLASELAKSVIGGRATEKTGQQLYARFFALGMPFLSREEDAYWLTTGLRSATMPFIREDNE